MPAVYGNCPQYRAEAKYTRFDKYFLLYYRQSQSIRQTFSMPFESGRIRSKRRFLCPLRAGSSIIMEWQGFRRLFPCDFPWDSIGF